MLTYKLTTITRLRCTLRITEHITRLYASTAAEWSGDWIYCEILLTLAAWLHTLYILEQPCTCVPHVHMNYHIAGNFCQEKNFATWSSWQNFVPLIFLSCVNDYIEHMAAFTVLAKICNTKVPGLGEIILSENFRLYGNWCVHA